MIHLFDPSLECPSHDIQEFINIFSGIFVKIVKPVKNMFDLPWIHKPWPVLVRPRIFFFIYARVERTPWSDCLRILFKQTTSVQTQGPSNSGQCQLLSCYVVQQDSTQFFAKRFHLKLSMKSDDPINLEINWLFDSNLWLTFLMS